MKAKKIRESDNEELEEQDDDELNLSASTGSLPGCECELCGGRDGGPGACGESADTWRNADGEESEDTDDTPVCYFCLERYPLGEGGSEVCGYQLTFAAERREYKGSKGDPAWLRAEKSIEDVG